MIHELKVDFLEKRTLLSASNENGTCGGIEQFLANEANDDLLAEAQANLKETTYTRGHLSNLATLARSSAMPLYEWLKGSPHPYKNVWNTLLLGAEGVAYHSEYYFYSNCTINEATVKWDTGIDSRYALQLHKEATWGKTLSGIWLGIWLIEAGYYTLGSTFLKTLPSVEFIGQSRFHTVAPAMGLIMVIDVLEDIAFYQKQKERASLAVNIPSSLNDAELMQIGAFVSQAQDTHETLYLLSCDLLKFAGNAVDLWPAFTWYWYGQHHEINPHAKLLGQASTLMGTIGYSLYGLWQATEWAWDKGSTWWARHEAAFDVLGGHHAKAADNLLESDPEFIISRLLERLDEEATSDSNKTANYLEALGVSTTDIKALRDAEGCDTKARQYLATQLKIPQ